MMAVGGFYALVGAFRSLINTSGPASFIRWAVGYALVLGLLGTGAFLLYGWTINAPTEVPPPDSNVPWIPNEVHVDPNTNRMAAFGGSVSNLDSEWSIENVAVRIIPTFGARSLPHTLHVHIPVMPGVIGPGERGTYDEATELPQLADGYKNELTWDWTLR